MMVKQTVMMPAMSQLKSALIPTGRAMATSSRAATDAASAAAGSVTEKMTVAMDRMNTRLSDVVSFTPHFPLTFYVRRIHSIVYFF